MDSAKRVRPQLTYGGLPLLSGEEASRSKGPLETEDGSQVCPQATVGQ